jgi:hypothetical protein
LCSIRNVQKFDDACHFHCIVENEGGETRQRVTIHIQGRCTSFNDEQSIRIYSLEMPTVRVYPQLITYSDQWNVTLTCIDTVGIPRPLLIWRRQHARHSLEQSSRLTIHHGILTIMMATEDDQGMFIVHRHEHTEKGTFDERTSFDCSNDVFSLVLTRFSSSSIVRFKVPTNVSAVTQLANT